ALVGELDDTKRRVEELGAAIAAGALQLDADVRELDALREMVMSTGEAVTALRSRADELESTIKGARADLDAIRAVVSELDVARATAQADLSHLAHTCEDAVNATLDEVVVEVEQLERDGKTTPDAAVVLADEADDEEVRLKPDTTGARNQEATGTR